MKNLLRPVLLMCLMLLILGAPAQQQAVVQSAGTTRLVIFEGFFLTG